ncbi:polycystin-2-like protein 1 isoform X2 [Leptinotarsa decemlineata]|uniref:polycystin-2-like protein 1 isoform X2 n=1 Tax=Leptinotarsa decemlineata TaxID=7539 RepID=UPI003D3059FD
MERTETNTSIKDRKNQENEAKHSEKNVLVSEGDPPKKKKRPRWITRDMAEEEGREEVLRTTFNEFFIYSIFVILMTIYVTGIHHRKAFYLTKGLTQQFVERQFDTVNDAEITFLEITTAADFWIYAEGHMMDSFYWEATYSTEQADENAMHILQENRVLGVPRIRQVRVRNDSCVVHEYFRRLFLNCYDMYSDDAVDKETFGLGKKTAWVYSPQKETKSLSYWGKITTYGGGGYYADFAMTRNKTAELFAELKDNLWIRGGTRAIFIDFALYNANLNLFAVCKMAFEFPTTGGIMTTADFRSFGLLRIRSNYDWFVMACECACYLFIVFYIFEEIREILYFRLKYLARFWNYVDVFIITLTLVSGAFSIMKMLMIKQELYDIMDNGDKYGNLEYIAWMHLMYNNLIAVDLFLIYVKIFKYLNFNRTMGQLNNTLKNCAMDILGFSIMFFIIFFAFAELGYLIFGSEVENFSSFGVAMFTLLRTILGDFDYQEIEAANRILAPIYFLSYIFLVFFVLLNMFLAIINDTYSDVKTEIALAPDEMQMTEYLSQQIRNLLRRLGSKCVSEKSETKSEINATLRQIREVLKKCGFSDLEIEMFFARYNVDPLAEIGVADIDKLMNELEDILKGEDVKYESSFVRVSDFVAQQERLEQIDRTIGKLVEQVKILLLKLDQMSNVRKVRNE